MQFRKNFEGVTGLVRSAAAALSRRLGSTLTALGVDRTHHHRIRRVAVVGVAAAVFTGSGATAAWAISNTEAPVEEAAAAAPAETAAPATEEATSEAATEAPATEAPATTEAPAEEEPAPEEPAGPVVLPEGTAGLDSGQLANAVTIIETGDELGFGERGWAVALSTSMQESMLVNVDYGHDDSLGLFQQRPSMGWGSAEEILDPATSASKFYNTLADVGGWEDMSVAGAAQSVQRSAFPDYYAQWEDEAYEIIDAYQSAS